MSTTATALRALLARRHVLGIGDRLARDMQAAANALERVEDGIREMEMAEQGPRAATEPPWAMYLDPPWSAA